MEVVVALLFGYFLGTAITILPAHACGREEGRSEMYKNLTGETLGE